MTSCIHRAVCKNDIFLVKQLIREGVDLNEATKDGFNMTPLHFVGLTESASVCTALCAAGARTNRRAMRGLTPLHIAAVFHHDAITEILSMYRGDFYAKTDDGFTPDKLADRSYDFRRSYWDSLGTLTTFDSIAQVPALKVSVIATIPTTVKTNSEDHDLFEEIISLRTTCVAYTQMTVRYLKEIDEMMTKLNSQD